jgi:hypothetical protein
VVSVITAGLLLLVYGETKFHLVGFLLVMAAAMLAGLRWTITQVLLQGTPGSAHGAGVARKGGLLLLPLGWRTGRQTDKRAGGMGCVFSFSGTAVLLCLHAAC